MPDINRIVNSSFRFRRRFTTWRLPSETIEPSKDLLEERMMRQLSGCLLLAFTAVASAQSLPDAAPDPDLLQAWPAWLVGDHAKARIHFLAAARRGNPLGQYNLAMMLMHGEGGPVSASQACALLRAASARVELARPALERCGAATQGIRDTSAAP